MMPVQQQAIMTALSLCCLQSCWQCADADVHCSSHDQEHLLASKGMSMVRSCACRTLENHELHDVGLGALHSVHAYALVVSSMLQTSRDQKGIVTRFESFLNAGKEAIFTGRRDLVIGL